MSFLTQEPISNTEMLSLVKPNNNSISVFDALGKTNKVKVIFDQHPRQNVFITKNKLFKK